MQLSAHTHTLLWSHEGQSMPYAECVIVGEDIVGEAIVGEDAMSP